MDGWKNKQNREYQEDRRDLRDKRDLREDAISRKVRAIALVSIVSMVPIVSKKYYITMTQYRYQLERYRGRNTRHVCPQCGRKNVFTRYVDTENNNIYISDNVGKCNRLDKCGYHATPSRKGHASSHLQGMASSPLTSTKPTLPFEFCTPAIYSLK